MRTFKKSILMCALFVLGCEDPVPPQKPIAWVGQDASDEWRHLGGTLGKPVLEQLHVAELDRPKPGDYYGRVENMTVDGWLKLRDLLAKLAARDRRQWDWKPDEKLENVLTGYNNDPPDWWRNAQPQDPKVYRLDQFKTVGDRDRTGGFFFVYAPKQQLIMVQRWIPQGNSDVTSTLGAWGRETGG